MTKEEQEKLAEQVSQMDGTAQEPSKPLAGQKLKSVTNRNKLSDEEQASMDEFLQKTKTSGKRVIGESQIGSHAEIIDETPVANGWIMMDKSKLKTNAMFYPEDWQFMIRPASTDAIKKWNSVDESRKDFQIQWNQVFNEMIKSSIAIKTPTGMLNWTHINAWDRFLFILEARRVSFTNNNRIEFTEPCDVCGADVTYVVDTDSIYFDMPDQEIIDKHWDVDEMCWKIDPKDYDMNGSIIKLYPPTLGKNDAIFQWAYAQAQTGKQLNEGFLEFLPWMMKSAPKDAKLLDKAIKEYERQYRSWDFEMFDFMQEIIRNVNVASEDKLIATCPDCGSEVHSTIQFQNGLKSLFTMESGRKRFGRK